MRVNITLCVWTSHYACEHHTMRVIITLCVWTSHYACEHHTVRVNIKHVCVYFENLLLTFLFIFLLILRGVDNYSHYSPPHGSAPAEYPLKRIPCHSRPYWIVFQWYWNIHLYILRHVLKNKKYYFMLLFFCFLIGSGRKVFDQIGDKFQNHQIYALTNSGTKSLKPQKISLYCEICTPTNLI
jgi:hypothetical protein